MAAVTIRNISVETHRALKSRAARNSRSTEAEIRAILDDAVRPAGRVKFGTALAELTARHGGVDIAVVRDPTPTKVPDLS